MKQEVDGGGEYSLLCAACSSRLKGPQASATPPRRLLVRSTTSARLLQRRLCQKFKSGLYPTDADGKSGEVS